MDFLIFFFVYFVFIGGPQTNIRRANHHLMCWNVHALAVKSMTAIKLY